MVKFYFLPGSRHSSEAEKLLHAKKLPYEKIDVTEMKMIADLDRELGIHKLPTVVDNESRYEGIAEVRTFIESKSSSS